MFSVDTDSAWTMVDVVVEHIPGANYRRSFSILSHETNNGVEERLVEIGAFGS